MVKLVKFKKLIFVCSGNYFRSRFCEHWFNALAKAQGLHWRATSRGLQTWMADGLGPISSYTVEGLAARGLHLDGDIRYPISLSETDLENADLVIAVKEAEHRPMMRRQFPAWIERIEYWHVDDIDCATPDESLAACESCVQVLVERLAAWDVESPELRQVG
jgi:protein-tyrosine phosphatase